MVRSINLHRSQLVTSWAVFATWVFVGCGAESIRKSVSVTVQTDSMAVLGAEAEADESGSSDMAGIDRTIICGAQVKLVDLVRRA